MVLLLPLLGPLSDDDNLLQNLLRDTQLIEANRSFVVQTGNQRLAAHHRAVCAFMGEQALVDFSNGLWHIGSCDATTCLITVAVCHITKKAWAAHYNSSIARSDTSILNLLPGHMQRPDLWLVGSFREPTGESAATLAGVLQQLQRCELPFHVRLACVDAANTDASGAPRTLHVTVRCTSGACVERQGLEASPNGFEDRGPMLPRRFIHDYIEASWIRSGLRHIVDTVSSRLRIPGLRCRQLSPSEIHYITGKIGLPDDEFLREYSTSPDYEPPYFVEEWKQAWCFALSLATAAVAEIPDALFEWKDPEPEELGGDKGDGVQIGWRALLSELG